MSIFVKKFVEKAFLKKHVKEFTDSLEPDDVNPHLVFHYGVLSESTLLAYDSIQQIIAISTKNGQIKLFGKDGSQALLESPQTLPGKYLLFIENQGILVYVTVNNHIEVWDLQGKCLSVVHHFGKEITSCTSMCNGHYLYVGSSTGDIDILKLHQEPCHIEKMNYHIPLSDSYGNVNEAGSDVSAKFVLPQPTAKSKRVLIIYSDGVMKLWAIRESKVICASSGGNILQSTYQEVKKVTAACWACSAGTKVVVGYTNGDVILWSVPSPSDSTTEQDSRNGICAAQIASIYKLNLGYKAERIPISKLKWVDSNGKSSRLYVLGSSECHSPNLLQVVLLNENTETRTIKLGLHLPESLIDLEIMTSSIGQNKKRCNALLLLGRSSYVHTYDDSLIERYLVHCQNKSSSPSLPKEEVLKIPYGDSRITVTKFFTSLPCMPGSTEEDFNLRVKNSLPFFPFERSVKDGSTASGSFYNVRNLFITGHSSGAVNFWDASCPFLLSIASVTQQSDNDSSLSGVPLTALYFSYDSHILVSGDQNGMVRIYTLKSEPFAPQSTFVSFQGSAKKGGNHIVRRIKSVKINGAVLCITASENLKQLVIGSDQGYVALIDPEGPNILYQKHIVSEFCTGIISLHFQTCSFHGFEKNVIIVATKDSSLITLERDTGNTLSSGAVRPHKPSLAVFTCILDGHGTSSLQYGTGINNTSLENSTSKQSFVLLCLEKAVYAFSLLQLVQGVKKVLYKKKFTSSCYWASTFGSPHVGLVLLFASGKIEIRSLPELSLVKESSIRALKFSTSRRSSIPDIMVSSSTDGDLIIVNRDQELLFVSTLPHTQAYRHVDSFSKVVDKDLINSQGVIISSSPVKEKKKGIFGSMIKDNKNTNTTNGFEPETQTSGQSIEELSTLFSTVNFPAKTESEEKSVMDEEDVDLDLDDIEIEDFKQKPKGHPVIAGLFRNNITNKFQAFNGKLKKVKNDKAPETDDEKAGAAVNQIKRKYGYASSGDSSVANVAKTKLTENLNKLQGINMKTSEMQETARSFSSMAKEVLRFAQSDTKGFSS